MADFVQSIDPSKLVLIGTALSLFTSGFEAPNYNFPLFLFGLLTQETNSDSSQSLQAFTGLLGISVFLDVIWMFNHEQHWFIRLFSVLILLLKLPTFLAFGTSLRQRGQQFSGFGVHGNETVWSMPGGFTSLGGGRSGYEPVDIENEPSSRAAPPPPPVKPSDPPPSVGYQAA